MKTIHKSALAAMLMAALLAACGQSDEKPADATEMASDAASVITADDAAEQAMKAAEEKTDKAANAAGQLDSKADTMDKEVVR